LAVLFADQNAYRDLDPQTIPVTPNLPEDVPALQLVLKDLNLAEYYLLAKGMTVEWDKDDRLYLFRMPQAFWEGSSVPRSSLGMPLIMEHIESLMPQIMNALFNDDPPFECDPLPKTSMDACRATKEILWYQLDQMNFKEETRIGVKECFSYGTVVWKLSWDQHDETQLNWKRGGPMLVKKSDAGPVLMPTKESQSAKRIKEKIQINMPKVEALHVRHSIPDPSLRRPDVRRAKYHIHRTYPTLEDLEDLRGKNGYHKLPPKEELIQLFFPPKEMPERSLLEGRSTASVLNTGVSSLDINMEFKAMPRWQMASSDPNLQPLECLEYWTRDKVIVVLNRKLVIKNDINPYGFLPFLSAVYIDVPDSFYGIGVAKLLGGEQRLQQGVINSRLDDLALRLSGTFIRKRGANTPTQQVRLRPGGIIDSDDEKGIQMIQYPPAITDAFEEVAQSDARAQRRTGANEFVTQGSAPGTGQIGRTSAGVQTLAAGVGARIGYFVDTIANQFFIPALEAFQKMNAMWLDEEQITEILDARWKKAYGGDPLDVKNARLKFRMLAGAKLRARQQMAQNFPNFSQFLMAPPIQQALQDQSLKLDLAELAQRWCDMNEIPGRQSLIVPLTKEDLARQKARMESTLQTNVIAQKHKANMEEIGAKGESQMAARIIQELAKHISPEAAQAAVDSARQHSQAMRGLDIDQQVADQPPEPAAPSGGA
jgi:hypothetical protein